jgi:tetratricopeptide (TPR) repeat protein
MLSFATGDPGERAFSGLSALMRRIDWSLLACLAILAAGTITVYSHTLSVPLLLDDRLSIAENLSIRRLWPIGPVLSPPTGSGVGGRPLLNLTFAINYAFGGTAPAGYHRVNLLIHILASWILFSLVRRTLKLPGLEERFGRFATALGLATGAIWAWHPVQIQSVTYISERAESLMGLFYLLTLYCFIRGAVSPGRRPRRMWYSLSVLACVAGTGTKEIIATAPLMVLLYDRTFISGTFQQAWRRNRPLYLGLVASLLLLGPRIVGLKDRSVVYGVGFGGGIAWWDYGLGECRVILKYFLLSIWPSPLVFDYGPTGHSHLKELWPYASVLTVLLAATGIALRRSPKVGFAAAWFMLILAPTSSIVPLVGQAMAENRLYLPLAGVVAGVAVGAFAVAGRWSLPILGISAICLGLATVRRNMDFVSEQRIWDDTIAKVPRNCRAHNSLGNTWLDTPGHLQEAIAQYKEALRLEPNYPEAHYNLGSVLCRIPGRMNDAIAEFGEALRLKADYPDARNNLGLTLEEIPGRLNDAIAQFEEAIRLNPDSADAHYNLGNAWAKAPGHLGDAIAQYEDALRLRPDFAHAHTNLGNALMEIPGRLNDAIAQYEAALRLEPDSAETHNDLANALFNAPGRVKDSIAQYEEALRLKPDSPEAHYNLGNAFQRIPGRMNDAIAQYEEALRIRPDLPGPHNELGYALEKIPGRQNDAIAQYEEALRLKPDYLEAHNNLGSVLLGMPGRLNDAIAQFEAASRLEPKSAEILYNLAQALNAVGRTQDSIARYEEALRLKPDFAAAHYKLALILSNTPGRSGDARTHLEAVLRLQPGNEAAKKLMSLIRAPKE